MNDYDGLVFELSVPGRVGYSLPEADVPEARLGLVKPEAPAEIILDAFQDKRFRGKVKEITPRVNRSKATVVVKVSFTDPSDGVLPEMAARVSFLSKPIEAEALKQKPKTVVPGAAVVERGGEKVVFVIDQGKVRMTPVALGAALTATERSARPARSTVSRSCPGTLLAPSFTVKRIVNGSAAGACGVPDSTPEADNENPVGSEPTGA